MAVHMTNSFMLGSCSKNRWCRKPGKSNHALAASSVALQNRSGRSCSRYLPHTSLGILPNGKSSKNVHLDNKEGRLGHKTLVAKPLPTDDAMSKQFYIAKAVDNGACDEPRQEQANEETLQMKTQYVFANCPPLVVAHETDIFSIAVTPNSVISGSGASTLRIHSTTTPDFPIAQSIDVAHKLGCHHVTTAKGGSGQVACSAGFGGEVNVWRRSEAGDWTLDTTLRPSDLIAGNKGGAPGTQEGAPAAAITKTDKTTDAWALALSKNEQYLAYTTHDGRVGVWDLQARAQLLVYSSHNRATSSFAMAVDLSQDGKYTAAGYQSGSVNVFNNDQSKLVYTLPGLAKPVRAVAFSPLGKRLAAGGDAGVISLYDMKHGEPVGNLTPPGSTTSSSAVWVMSLDFSASGEYLLAGYMDGKVRVWNVELGTCVATNGETEMSALWSVKWLPPKSERPGADTESFCTAGADRRLTFYREAGSNPII
ncbi:superkiller protein 8 [Sporothrix schenckii 1099-18]|uniref:Superkiller protein 8 n=1 Tax=Sporothrix schenckii 1099-18 TaxID=1397361 RepID=A0A0F2LUW3_SPOSC|nr:superkiller protein 8 [Sporothrix schenckii 1099-18]KJR81258.1 superkiller protein 8 [Sporothrix schenckii 1099-18]